MTGLAGYRLEQLDELDQPRAAKRTLGQVFVHRWEQLREPLLAVTASRRRLPREPRVARSDDSREPSVEGA